MKKIITTALLVLSIIFTVNAQSNDVLAKSYFLKAQEAYSNGENTTALEQLDKTVEYLGATNAKIEALYVKINLVNKDIFTAYKHINTYFEIADESHSDYNALVNEYANLQESRMNDIKKLSFSDEGLAVYKEGDKYGYTDNLGNIKIPIKYEGAHFFTEGLAGVKLNGSWGYINKNNQVIIPLKYTKVGQFSKEEAAVLVGEKIGIINKKGEIMVQIIYDYIKYYDKDRIKIKLNGKFGFINKKEEPIIPAIYDYISDFDDNNHAIVSFNGKWGSINKSNETIIPFKYEKKFIFSKKHFDEEVARVKQNGKYGFINKKGKEIIPVIYQEIGTFNRGDFSKQIERVKLNNKYGYINKNNEIIIAINYDDIYPSYYRSKAKHLQNRYEKFYIVKNNGNYGVTNYNGEIIIPIKYSKISRMRYDKRRSNFPKEFFQVKEKYGKHGIIDSDGNEAVPIVFDDEFGSLYYSSTKNKLYVQQRKNHALKTAYLYGKVVSAKNWRN